MDKRLILVVMLLVTTVARAFDFSVTATTGQTLYFNVTSGTTVAVVNPGSGGWDIEGALTVPATVENGSTTYSVTEVNARAFHNCAGLTSVVLPEGVTSIGMMAFYGCSSLVDVSLPSTITTISSMAFGSSGIYTDSTRWADGMLVVSGYLVAARNAQIDSVMVTLPDELQGIGNNAFKSCTRLYNVSMPASVRFIGSQAFADCSALDTLHMAASVPPVLDYDAFLGISHTVNAKVPCQAGDAYRAAANWSALNIIEDTCGGGQLGIGDVIAEGLSVQSQHGGILVSGAEGMQVTVTDVAGRIIVSRKASASEWIALPGRGIYFVGAPGLHSCKVLCF